MAEVDSKWSIDSYIVHNEAMRVIDVEKEKSCVIIN